MQIDRIILMLASGPEVKCRCDARRDFSPAHAASENPAGWYSRSIAIVQSAVMGTLYHPRMASKVIPRTSVRAAFTRARMPQLRYN